MWPRSTLRVAAGSLVLLWMLATTARAAPTTLCPSVQNDCTCTPGSDGQLPSITCNFTSADVSPVLSGNSTNTYASLDKLDLTGNNLDALPADFFQGIEHISSLVLARNNFSEVSPAILQLQSVSTLDLSYNSLRTLHAARLTAIPRLRALNLAHNQITRLSKDWYDVKAADLPRVNTVTPRGNLQHMAVLNLSHNALDAIPDDFFKSMGHLASLDLSHNRLTEISDHTFHTLKFSLAALNLSHNAMVKMAPMSLQHLSHLRQLGLAYNTLGDISALEFPPHLVSLDLSHSAVSDINHCQLSTLTDLSNILLKGNDLQCSCQLYLLFMWYKTQHNALQNRNADALNWNCTTSVNTTAGDHHTDQNVAGRQTLVREQQGCEDTETHCHSLDHQEHHEKGNGQIEVILKVASSGLDIMATWTIEENEDVIIEGFRLSYIPEDSEAILSPVLPQRTTTYTIIRKEIEKHFRVCLDVMSSEMVIVRQVCQMFKDEPNNVVVGILAGVIFLVPCAAAIIWIVIKDHRIGKTVGYRVLAEVTADQGSPKKSGTETDSSRSSEKKNSDVDSESGKDAASFTLPTLPQPEHTASTGPAQEVGQCTVQIQEIKTHSHAGATSIADGLLHNLAPTEGRNNNASDAPNKLQVCVIRNGISGKEDKAQGASDANTSGLSSIYPCLPAESSKGQVTGGSNTTTPPIADQNKNDLAATMRQRGIDNPVFTCKEEHADSLKVYNTRL